MRVTTGREADIGAEGSGATAARVAAWAGPLSTRVPRLPRAAAALAWLGRQAARQGERWTLWTPVALGCGAGLYFTAPGEPQAWVAWAGAALVVALVFVASRWSRSRAITAALILSPCAGSGCRSPSPYRLPPKPVTPDAWVSGDGATVAVRSDKDPIFFRPDVKLFGAELWDRRRGLTATGGQAMRDVAYDCDHWSCMPKPGAPVRLAEAWNVKRELKPGRIDALCASAELIVLRDNFQPGTCPGKLILTGEDFERGGSAELFRQPDGSWKALWAQDLRGRRPWTWGPYLR